MVRFTARTGVGVEMSEHREVVANDNGSIITREHARGFKRGS